MDSNMMQSQLGWCQGYYCLPVSKIEEYLLDVHLSMYTAKAWLCI